MSKLNLDYAEMISDFPVCLSIGNIRKPKLKDIFSISFSKFTMYEFIMRLTPEIYYSDLKKDSALNGESKGKTLFDIILTDKDLRMAFAEIFDFFFEEKVEFNEDFQYFLIFDKNENNNVIGAITPENIDDILDILQQICCIQDKHKKDQRKYKNDLARKLMEKMDKAAAEQQKQKKADLNLTIPNLISAVSNIHPSLNYLNVFELTIFQLMDAFNRIQSNILFEIDSTRVSVWGDEKNTFDVTNWYKNYFERKQDDA